MGLPSGLLWAKQNLDVSQADGFAISPFQYDCSFVSWGNVECHNPINDDTFDYNWGGANPEAPYYEGQPYGETPGCLVESNLALSQDAAHVVLGGPWRIPTIADFVELINNCFFVQADGQTIISDDEPNKLVVVNNTNGIYLKSKNNGRLLFLSCSGVGTGFSWLGKGDSGFYWTSTFRSEVFANDVDFNSGGVYCPNIYNRCYAFAIRPVFGASNRSLSAGRLSLAIPNITETRDSFLKRSLDVRK